MAPNISDWRFCKVRAGEKVPYPKGWQNTPLELSKIPEGDNYGLLSGEHSGILAIDFDGLWAFDWWEKNLSNVILPNTITWTSGKPNRAQFAYKVPVELWPFIETRKFDNGLPKPDKEGIEFRWNGCQSVLPPSIHPDTHKPYEWIGVEEAVECPLEVLEFLIALKQATKKPVVHSAPKSVSLSSPELVELDKVMSEYKKHFGSLSYDQWRNTTWACITHAGVGGIAVMQVFYPEQETGEYDKLYRTYRSGTTWGIGTLIKMCKDVNPNFNMKPAYKDSEKVKHILSVLSQKR